MNKIFKVPQYELTEKNNSNFNLIEYLIEYFILASVVIGGLLIKQGIPNQVQIGPITIASVGIGGLFIAGAAILTVLRNSKFK
ncbi:MAG: hypothetical protein WA102_04865 [Candidatus Methanoperedens sp.]